ncbi:hypothetical protein Taro_026179 [Colocasia esculenta]|uniref:Uncharacterized protein n=1 Tax=Colocasia esculenta TaxID=4460 RepID=A0A843VJV3_COLES|nr:hypothetical protein [Colocasia esculenta]
MISCRPAVPDSKTGLLGRLSSVDLPAFGVDLRLKPVVLKPGHVKSECPEALKKAQPRWTKSKQKAMVGTWSEEENDDDEESSEAEESQTKICLMARGEEGEEEEGYLLICLE